MSYLKPFSQTQTLDPFGHNPVYNTLFCANLIHHGLHPEVPTLHEKDPLP